MCLGARRAPGVGVMTEPTCPTIQPSDEGTGPLCVPCAERGQRWRLVERDGVFVCPNCG